MINLKDLHVDLVNAISRKNVDIHENFEDEEGYNRDELAATIGILMAIDKAGYTIIKKEREDR